MPEMDCIKKAAFESKEKIMNGRLKLTKMVKPMLKFISRKRKTNSVTPSTCNYDVVESVQNELNETELFQLHFKFYEEPRLEEREENARNEELEARLRESAARADPSRSGILRMDHGREVVERIGLGTYFAVPVHFVEGPAGGFTWAPLPAGDVSPTRSQTPEQRVPVMVTSAA